MGITVKKAGQIGKQALQKASANGGEKTVLRPPRAVAAHEADRFQPARDSTQHTMMPWRGWFQQFLKENLGEDRYHRWRKTLLFMDGQDLYDLQQAPKQTQKVPISKTDPTLTHQYRYPAPGSQPAPMVPEWEADEDPFDSGYFKRDTRRRYLNSEIGDPLLESRKVELMSGDIPKEEVEEELAKIAAGPESSPGNKGMFATGPSDFDSTGLRATMSVTWDKLHASLDAHMPDHLPTPTWAGQEAQIAEWHVSRGLPIPVGQYYAPLKTPLKRRVATW